MKPSDFQKTVQCRFESCLKKVVRSVVKDYYKELKLAEENIDAGWVIVNGNRIQIKRKQFEKIIDTLDEI